MSLLFAKRNAVARFFSPVLLAAMTFGPNFASPAQASSITMSAELTGSMSSPENVRLEVTFSGAVDAEGYFFNTNGPFYRTDLDTTNFFLEVDGTRINSHGGEIGAENVTQLDFPVDWTGASKMTDGPGNAIVLFPSTTLTLVHDPSRTTQVGDPWTGKLLEAGTSTPLSAQTITVTNSIVDDVNPSVVSAETNSAGDKIFITWDESVTASSSTWRLKINGVPFSGTYSQSSGGTIPANQTRLNLSGGQTIFQGDSLEIYNNNDLGFGVDDLAGNEANGVSEASPLSVTNQSTITDQTKPTVSSATLDSDGTTLTIEFDEGMTAIGSSSLSGMTVAVDSATASFTYGSIASNGDTSLDLTLDSAVAPGADVKLSYDGSGGLEDDATTPNTLDSFTDLQVTNNSTISGEAPAIPYTGPIINAVGGSSSDFNAASGQVVTVEGQRLGGVTKAFINGQEVPVNSVSDDSFQVTVPDDLDAGTYDLEIESAIGNLTYLDAITIVGTTSVETTSYGEVTAWTSRISDTQVKVYVKFPTVGEKVRISHQTGGSGSYESIYVKTTSSETMEGLRIVEGVGTYVVRTIDLADINRIRVTVGDEELVQVRYNN